MTLINTDAEPVVPKGWCLESHQGNGMLELDFDSVKLLSINHLRSSLRSLDDYRIYLLSRGDVVLNATYMQALYSIRTSVPLKWSPYVVFFFGTVYLDHEGQRLVPYLWFRGNGLVSGYEALNEDWSTFGVAAIWRQVSHRLDKTSN